MKTSTRVFGVVCVLTTLIHLECADDAVKSSSEELERHVKAGNVEAVKEIYRKQKIRNDKYAYICACSSLREINRHEFRKFGGKPNYRLLPGVQKWAQYIELETQYPVPRALQHLLKANATGEYIQFGTSMCRIYSVCNEHTTSYNSTALVLFSAIENPNESIFDILKRQSPDKLITEQDMKYMNHITQLHHMRSIPYTTYTKPDCSTIFAVPMVKEIHQCRTTPEDSTPAPSRFQYQDY